MGLTHLKAYRNIPNARVVALCDAVRLPVDGMLAAAGGNIGEDDSLHFDMSEVKATHDLAELLADPSIDLIDICVPTLAHPKLAIAALQAGRTARGLPPYPVKVGVVSAANIHPDCRFMTFGPARRLIYTTPRSPQEKITALRAAGAEVFIMGETRVDLMAMLDSLYAFNLRNLFVEGGGTIIAEFFRLGLVDEFVLFLAPRVLGDAQGKSLFSGEAVQSMDQTLNFRLAHAASCGDDLKLTYKPRAKESA